MKKRILLVEDEPTIQKLLYFVLSREFDIHVAGNGYEAFLWLESRHIPDLIIMDWVMPHMDGETFLKCIKVSGLYCEIPVIVLSSSEGVVDELKSVPLAVDKCLSKPFDPVMLKETITQLINKTAYGIVN